MQTVGRYQILDKLGQGGMGTVYKAYDPLIERVVAVKVISTQLDLHPEWRDRFFREARAAGQLSHPNIITIYDLGEQEGQPYLAMEFLEGRDLERRMRGSDSMTLPRKLEITMAVCEGLAHAHGMGIVHRDIKPANVFVTDAGHVKILDFGLARVLASDLTHSHMMLGTMNYMAPEQIRGEKIDHRADIFAVGVLCYELLCGRKAFHSDSFAATMYQILQYEPEPIERLNPNLPPQLSAIVGRAMAKSREDRYQHVTDLLHDLDLVYEQLRGGVPRGAGWPDAGSHPSNRPPSGPRAHGADISNAPTMAGVHTPAHDAPRIEPRPGSGSGPRSDPGSAAPVPAADSQGSAHARRSRALVAGAAAIALAILLTVVWLVRGNRPAPSPEPAAERIPPAASQESAPVSPAPSVVPDQTSPPSATPHPSPPATSDTPAPNEAAPNEAAPKSPPAPSAERSPRQPAASTSREALQAAAQGFESVAAARSAALSQRAPDLVPDAWAAATREESRARSRYDAGQYTAATAQLYAAAGLFRTAESLARNAAAAAAAAEIRTPVAEPPPRVTAPPPEPAPPPAPAPRTEPLPTSRPPVPAAAPAPGPPPEEAIAAVVRRYVAALENRDMAALKAIWPELSGPQQAAIQSDFGIARSIGVDFASPKIQVNGSTAIVSGRRRYEVRTRDGHNLQNDTMTTITLRNAGGTWQIESMQHQAVR